jgi:hypothetical protein
VEELEPSVLLVPLLEDDELDEDEAELPPLAALLSSKRALINKFSREKMHNKYLNKAAMLWGNDTEGLGVGPFLAWSSFGASSFSTFLQMGQVPC